MWWNNETKNCIRNQIVLANESLDISTTELIDALFSICKAYGYQNILST